MLADDAAELGCTAELELVENLLGGNTGAHRQLRFGKLWDEDLTRLVSEIAADTRP